jgi:glycosyltransferase involved in cell wall biosynthesis
MRKTVKNSANAPLVSIVMPTFNQEGFIRKAVQSVIDQSVENWELIVVNNFSTDNTLDVVESFRDPRIKLIDFANNGVIAASRNLGITKSSGDLIAFLDSDDYWHKEKIKLSLKKIAQGYDLVCHGEYFFTDGSDNFVPTKYGPEHLCTPHHLLTHGNCLSTSAIVVKRSVLNRTGLFDENKMLNTAEDFDLWLRIVCSGTRIGIIDDMLGYYRLHTTSASASKVRNARATLEVLKKNTNSIKLNLWTKLGAAIFRARISFFIWRTQKLTPK